MKNLKFLLVLTCMIVSRFALAQSVHVPADDLTRELYSLSANSLVEDTKEYKKVTDVPCNVVWEGDSVVWFDNLFPNIVFPDGSKVWVKGIVDHSIRITIKPQDVYKYTMDHGMMQMEMTFRVGALEGSIDAPTGYKDFQMVNNPKNGIIEPVDRNLVLCFYAEGEGEMAGIYDAAYNYALEAIGDANIVSLPEDAEAPEFLFHYKNEGSGAMETRIGHIYIDGNTAYIQGLCQLVHDAWLVGTVGDFGTIMLKEGQFIGVYDNQILYFTGVRNDNGQYKVSKIALSYQAETGGYQLAPGYLAAETTISLNVQNMYSEFDILPYNGEVATPRKPWNLQINYFDNGTPYVAFQYDTNGTNDEWLITDSIFYQVYFDDKLFTFKTDPYIGLEKDMTRIPVTFEDVTGDFTFFMGIAPIFLVYLDDSEWTRVGIQLVHSVNGVEKTSEISYLENPNSAIEDINQDDSEGPCFDLSGRIISKTANKQDLSRGLYIMNGKKIMIK